jgi:hypothetical protein
VPAGLGEVVGRGAAGRSGTGDQDVHFANHCWESVYSCEGVDYELDGGDRLGEEVCEDLCRRPGILGLCDRIA